MIVIMGLTFHFFSSGCMLLGHIFYILFPMVIYGYLSGYYVNIMSCTDDTSILDKLT